jgi:hypothetical protein
VNNFSSLTLLNCASIWIHILCVLSCVTNKATIQRASLTSTIHHCVHKSSGSVLSFMTIRQPVVIVVGTDTHTGAMMIPSA